MQINSRAGSFESQRLLYFTLRGRGASDPERKREGDGWTTFIGR